MRFFVTDNQRLPNAIFDFRKIPNGILNSFLLRFIYVDIRKKQQASEKLRLHKKCLKSLYI